VTALSKKLRSVEGDRLAYWCQGCEQVHHVRIGEGAGPRWGYNGNPDAPTFTPSVLYEQDLWTPPVTPENIEQWRANPWPQVQKRHVCHTFITDGRVQFLGDCTHALAGQTVDLPEWTE
jgi:hypothetical protein